MECAGKQSIGFDYFMDGALSRNRRIGKFYRNRQVRRFLFFMKIKEEKIWQFLKVLV